MEQGKSLYSDNQSITVQVLRAMFHYNQNMNSKVINPSYLLYICTMPFFVQCLNAFLWIKCSTLKVVY